MRYTAYMINKDKVQSGRTPAACAGFIGKGTMREEIIESVERMSKEDMHDVFVTLGIKPVTRAQLRKLALNDEAVAEYVLQY